ncbi:MAG: 1-deoxy-D-xylulose-5-phosphate reductoisomerase, partial [Gemmatimonadota bacterium]
MQGVAILGATGSVGESTLAVLDQHPERFRAVVLTGHRNVAALEALVQQRRPDVAVLSHGKLPSRRTRTGTEWRSGSAALVEAATHPDVDIVVNALVGAAGLAPTLAALRSGKRVALANKESLVCGGALVLDAAREGGGELIPVDSEHSAILQCIKACSPSEIERVVLTASGGPFREWNRSSLARVRPVDALRHPTWDMGAKIT